MEVVIVLETLVNKWFTHPTYQQVLYLQGLEAALHLSDVDYLHHLSLFHWPLPLHHINNMDCQDQNVSGIL